MTPGYRACANDLIQFNDPGAEELPGDDQHSEHMIAKAR